MSKLSNIALRKIAAAESDDRNPYSDTTSSYTLAENAPAAILRGIASNPELAVGPVGVLSSLVGTANGVGNLVGLLQNGDNLPTADELKQYNAMSLIPGVSGYRSIARDRVVDRALSGGKVDRSGILSEGLGQVLLTLIASGVGAGIGGAGGRGKSGALSGAAVGAGVSTIPALVALFKKRRSAKEHAEYLAKEDLISGNIGNPLAGSYNAGARAKMKLAALFGGE